MPRDYCLVLIPASTPDTEIDRAVADLLDPHATHFDFFEPYQAPCLECSWFS